MKILKKYPIILFTAIFVVSAILMVYTSSQESATMDELPHIPSGYSYVKFLDYRLNPEHPPLVKALAGLPLLGLNINFPLNSKTWTEDVNGQWDLGREFLYKSGNNPDTIVFASRIFPILLTLLTLVLIYIWSSELIGRKWALLPAFLFGLSPNILAHGHYVTTDIGAMLGTILATFAFVHFLLKPTKKNIILAGLALGVAELLKYSNVLLIPFFVVLVLAFYISELIRNKGTEDYKIVKRKWKLYLGSFILICVIALALIFLVYILFTWNYPIERQVSDTTTLLGDFPNKTLANINIWMAGNPIIRPLGHYFLGVLMVMQRSSGGNTGYFLGEISSAGWWYYFPVVFLLKEPIPSLMLIFGALFISLRIKREKGKKIIKRIANCLGTHFHEFAMLIFVIIYWAYSVRSPLNIGMRHLFPTLPFIYILVASAIKRFTQAKDENIENNKTTYLSDIATKPTKNITKKRMKTVIISILLIWFAAETAISFPYFISYFNQFGGGTQNGYKFATDSNYDWGQDMLRLKAWTEEEGIEKIAVDYFGGGDPGFYLGEKAIPWNSGKGNPKDEGIEWIVVSVNTLAQSMAREAEGFHRGEEGEYKFLRERNPNFKEGINAVPEPDERIGTSLFIYHL